MARQVSNSSDALTRAQTFERGNDFVRAVDAYLSLTPADVENLDVLQQCWEQVRLPLALCRSQQRTYTVRKRRPMFNWPKNMLPCCHDYAGDHNHYAALTPQTSGGCRSGRAAPGGRGPDCCCCGPARGHE